MSSFSKIKDKDTFVRCVAEDCIENMTDEDKDYLRKHPRPGAYHFGYAMYIRNHYIHGKKLSIGWCDPDDLSGEIMECIFSILLPDEYDANDEFIKGVYEDMLFTQVRNEYMRLYGNSPIEIVKRYRDEHLKKMEPLNIEKAQTEQAAEEFFESNKKVIVEKEIKKLKDNPDDRKLRGIRLKKYAEWIARFDTIHNATDEIRKKKRETEREIKNRMKKEIAEMVWQEEVIRSNAREYEIPDLDFESVLDEIKNLFQEQFLFVPLEAAFLKFRDYVDESVYTSAKDVFIQTLNNEWRLIRDMDPSWFDDREVARAALDKGFGLEKMKQFHDDEEMVRYALEKEGYQINCISERLRSNRELILLAAAHNKNGPIMSHECMEQYSSDDEVVYLACRSNNLNLGYVDSKYKEDPNLKDIEWDDILDILNT